LASSAVVVVLGSHSGPVPVCLLYALGPCLAFWIYLLASGSLVPLPGRMQFVAGFLQLWTLRASTSLGHPQIWVSGWHRSLQIWVAHL